MDTIFAEATPPGRGGVAVIRISGPDAWRCVEVLTGSVPSPRSAALRDLAWQGDLIDRALVLCFDEGRSFTGEQSAELQLHGAPVVVARARAVLTELGLRPASAGEFTRRAFLNGRLDLVEAEALADLLDADTEAQRKQAMRVADGALGRLVGDWRRDLVQAGALVEVTIDFADEEVPVEIPDECFDLIDKVTTSLRDQITSYPAAEALRQGFEVAIIGPPNVGKSSLLNRIARRDIAIVSEIAGTTRDIIELRTDLRGLSVTFLDSAGLRETSDPVESIGVTRARTRAAAADLKIYLTEDGAVDQSILDGQDIVVRTKSDLDAREGISISSLTGDGIEDLLDLVYEKLRFRTAGAGLIARERQAAAVRAAVAELSRIRREQDGEIVAEHIRRAIASLDELIGRVGAEDYLDVVFSSFCIGK
ncbi:tRNA uridine-5-carboxymethylaminomethyl(34) synthesis GTPase MnmE [Paracoccus pacificus]|uniref:tRNA modification GTPase MnmE n=1 Tax=Paracoccus pacificus TaxID=1463598 RepID=A0ABW4R4A0_9RHOB